jgi:hypothetical protein
MSDLINPFIPFIPALVGNEHDNAVISGSSPGTSGSIDAFANSQHLHDEMGRNLGTINHFLHGDASISDGHGMHLGDAHTFADTTTVTNSSGTPEVFIHHELSGDRVEDSHHQEIQTVDHLGSTDIIHNIQDGTTQTVSHF